MSGVCPHRVGLACGRAAKVTGEAGVTTNRDSFTKEYATDELVVEWEPRLCFHSQNCVRSLPQVFDDSRRPWIEVDAASTDEVEVAVAQCPSGALRTRRVGVLSAPQQQPPDVRASENGPLLVSGGVRILDAEGALLYEGDSVALCRCGGSSNKPFCDGTHKKNGFRA
jgi:uncharacterized Fe-S cluster protein YjdI